MTQTLFIHVEKRNVPKQKHSWVAVRVLLQIYNN